jgi:hypothetical protein
MRVLLDPAVVAAVVSEASHLDAPTAGSDRALSVRTISRHSSTPSCGW